MCLYCIVIVFSGVFFLFKRKTAYEMHISDWSSDVCSSDLTPPQHYVDLMETKWPWAQYWRTRIQPEQGAQDSKLAHRHTQQATSEDSFTGTSALIQAPSSSAESKRYSQNKKAQIGRAS